MWEAVRPHCANDKAFNAFLFALEYASIKKAHELIHTKYSTIAVDLFMEAARSAAVDFDKHAELKKPFQTIDMLAGWMDEIVQEEPEKLEAGGKYHLHGLAIACAKLVHYCAEPKYIESRVIYDNADDESQLDADAFDATYMCVIAIEGSLSSESLRNFWIWYLDKAVYEALEKYMIRE